MADDSETGGVSETRSDPIPSEHVEPVALGPGTVLAGRYVLEAKLGRGSMGIVFRAHDGVLDEVVALKVLRPEYGSEQRWTERLAREVRLARRIRHPNVCRVFNFGQADGHTFIVVELAPGGTLRAEIDAGQTRHRALAERVADASAIAAGLAAIHDAGIVHRDVNPQNVLRMADGRLVVCDFGLAIGAGETTTSIQGGTISYMAPEVVRGAQASFASDVWSLGVVMHEVVFGEKPGWRSPASFELVTPDIGRSRDRRSDVVLDACRACMAGVPSRRPRRAAEVVSLLRHGRRWWARRRRALGYAALAIVSLAAVGTGVRVARSPSPPAASASERPLRPAGRPVDWTNTSKVLLTVNERVRCLVVLPDRETVRMVWGTRAHAEDVDVTTGRHHPSPLVPAAFEQGCPDLSPDGRHLLFQGYADDGRAFAFVSPHADGSDAVPAVATDDPSVVTEPKWLPDGQSFIFDPDSRHHGVYSLVTKRATILPEVVRDSALTSFRWVSGDSIVLGIPKVGMSDTELVGLAWPALTETFRFRVEKFVLDPVPRGGAFYLSALHDEYMGIVTVHPHEKTAERLGFVPGRTCRYFSPLAGGSVFVDGLKVEDLWARDPEGRLERVTADHHVAQAARCGPDFLVTRREGGRSRVERIARDGSLLARLTTGPKDMAPSCLPDGTEWFYSRWESSQIGIFRCSVRGCVRISEQATTDLDVSPDGKRIAYLAISPRGSIVRWISIDGGAAHEVGAAESDCGPTWASPTTIWTSRRRGEQFIWTEVDADSGIETGSIRPAGRGCLEGYEDPASPVRPDLRVITSFESELRFLDGGKR